MTWMVECSCPSRDAIPFAVTVSMCAGRQNLSKTTTTRSEKIAETMSTSPVST